MSRPPWSRQQIPPRERDIADIRRGDKMLEPLIARIAEGNLHELPAWLRAAPINGAPQTTRAIAMGKIRAAGVDMALLRACGAELS